jgi:lipoyl(octanoyl) transferase
MADSGAVFRLLPTTTESGPWQMAADEVMLEGAAAGHASLRFYRWSEPTVSLGYFQPESVRRSDPLLASLPFVRRATGGATLVHDRELTYAVAVPLSDPWQRHSDGWIVRMHRVITVALHGLAIDARLVEPGERRKLGEPLCFLDQTPGDVLVKGRKVVGSAQRKRKSAILQHGGILLAQSAFTPDLPGLKELTNISAERLDGLEGAIVAAFCSETDCRFERVDWSEKEVARRSELIRRKYQSNSWNAKR